MSDDDRTPVEQARRPRRCPSRRAADLGPGGRAAPPASVEPAPVAESAARGPAPVATAALRPGRPAGTTDAGAGSGSPVVFGLVLLAISATSLVRVLTDVRIDDSLVLLILLVVAGALLLGAGVASAAREARSGRSRDRRHPSREAEFG